MCASASVSVNYDLTTGKTCIGMRTAKHKFAGGVDMQDQFIIEKILYLDWEFSLNAGDKNILDISVNLLKHLFICHSPCLLCIFKGIYKVIMLCGNHYRVNSHRTMIVIIFHCNLAFRIRTKVCGQFSFTVIIHRCAFATDVSKLSKKHM